MLDALKDEGYAVNGVSVGDGGEWTLASSNSTQIKVNEDGKTDRYGISWMNRRDDLLAAVNTEAKLGSSMFSEIWSEGLQVGIEGNDALRAIIDAAADPTTSFPDTKYGKQLRTIAKLINVKAARGVEREVFFTELYGWVSYWDWK